MLTSCSNDDDTITVQPAKEYFTLLNQCEALTESIGIEPNRVIGMDVRLMSSIQGTEAGVRRRLERGCPRPHPRH